MEKKQKILEFRERLDRTLAMPDLTDEKSIRSLVRDQLLRSSLSGNKGNIEMVAEKRTAEVSNFLDMLRTNDERTTKNKLHNEWKVKQDTEELRVMYREGPYGSPFHTLLLEGFVDGPIDVCLCVSWETTLYKKWWPQYNIPTFKIIVSECLKKVCVGEEISLIRVKVAWPVSDREALLHYFVIEYFKEDLIIILMNTISEVEDIDASTHGFTRDGIPEAKDTVRLDMVGGFVLQKINSNRTYFRTIANMDIKLDFVPPTLINFVARQLIGNGYKLYQKVVGSVATKDEDYCKALRGPMYARIREGLDPANKFKTTFSGANVITEKQETPVEETRTVTEIVEEEAEDNFEDPLNKEKSILNSEKGDSSSDTVQLHDDDVSISPEVQHALRTLDQAISIVRGRSKQISQQMPTSEAVLNSRSTINEELMRHRTKEETQQTDRVRTSLDTEDFRNNTKDAAPRVSNKDNSEGTITRTQPPASESMRRVCDEESLMANGFHRPTNHRGSSAKPKAKRGTKKARGFPCCFNLSLFLS